MKIVDIHAYEVAIPFKAPILSSFGVSYPARIRTFVRVHADNGLVGIGETGPSPLHPYTPGTIPRAFETSIKSAIEGEDPADHAWIARKLYHRPEAIAIEIACFDLLAKAAGLPLYRLLGGQGHRASVPLAAYSFFRLPGHDGTGAVTLDLMVAHCLELVERYGFDVVKIKLGAHHPHEELPVVREVREALGSRIGIRLDPNGAWSLPTALRAVTALRDLDLEYLEEPTRAMGTGDATVDTATLRRLRSASPFPIAADHCYRPHLLSQILRDQAADVVLADVYGCGGIAATIDYSKMAANFGLGVSFHSGTELGIGQLAKIHVQASLPEEARFASDAIYPEYEDDVLRGGKLEIEGGAMKLPQEPGLGVDLDDERLARWELTDERMRELDEYWRDLKADLGVGYPTADWLVRHY